MLTRTIVAACWLALLPGPAAAEAVDARLQWSAQRTLGLSVAGLVEAVAARPGAVFEDGEELLRLDPRPFAARQAVARAELAGIEPVAEEAEAEQSRLTAGGRTRVLEVHVRRGQAVNNQAGVQPALTVADADFLEAEADIAYRQLGELVPGDRLGVRYGRRRVEAQVVAIERAGGRGGAGPLRLSVRFAAATDVYPDFEQPVRIELP